MRGVRRRYQDFMETVSELYEHCIRDTSELYQTYISSYHSYTNAVSEVYSFYTVLYYFQSE